MLWSAMGQNIKNHPTTQCKFLLILHLGRILDSIYWTLVNLYINTKVYWQTCLYGDANRTARQLLTLKKNNINLQDRLELLASIYF